MFAGVPGVVFVGVPGGFFAGMPTGVPAGMFIGVPTGAPVPPPRICAKTETNTSPKKMALNPCASPFTPADRSPTPETPVRKTPTEQAFYIPRIRLKSPGLDSPSDSPMRPPPGLETMGISPDLKVARCPPGFRTPHRRIVPPGFETPAAQHSPPVVQQSPDVKQHPLRVPFQGTPPSWISEVGSPLPFSFHCGIRYSPTLVRDRVSSNCCECFESGGYVMTCCGRRIHPDCERSFAIDSLLNGEKKTCPAGCGGPSNMSFSTVVDCVWTSTQRGLSLTGPSEATIGPYYGLYFGRPIASRSVRMPSTVATFIHTASSGPLAAFFITQNEKTGEIDIAIGSQIYYDGKSYPLLR